MNTDLSPGVERVKIPCDAGQHWRFIELLLLFEPSDFSEPLFRSALPNGQHRSWLLHEGNGSECHSHARLYPLEHDKARDTHARSGDASGQPGYVIEVETYRSGEPHDETGKSVVTHSRFFEAVSTATGTQQLFVVARVALDFSASHAKWQASLLANPPEIAGLPSELGRIGLAGVTLRFRDSTAGLLQARLEADPSGSAYTVDLRFSSLAGQGELADLYELIMQKAERFGSLFITSEK
jgi:hypothetical protein